MPATGVSHSASSLEQIVREIFGAVGLTPTIGTLLIVFVASMVLKAVLVLAANKRIGYTVARVATDLRLDLMRALFRTRWEYFIRQPVGRFTNAMATEAGRHPKRIFPSLALLQPWSRRLYMPSWRSDGFLAGNPGIAIGAGRLVILYMFKFLITKARQAGRRQTKLLKVPVVHMTDSLVMIKPLENHGSRKSQTRY